MEHTSQGNEAQNLENTTLAAGFSFHQSTTKIQWSNREKDYVIKWDKDHQCNAGFIKDYILDKSFLQELRERGYDLDSIKFEIKKFAS